MIDYFYIENIAETKETLKELELTLDKNNLVCDMEYINVIKKVKDNLTPFYSSTKQLSQN